jgi:hypothetical protein
VAWLKSSDTSYNHPIVLAPLTWPGDFLDGLDPHDMCTVLFGLAWRCATYCAQHGLDYFVPDTVVAMMAGLNWQTRADQVCMSGYWTRSDTGDGWDLVDDAEHLFHIRRKAEIDWERARKRDTSNSALTVPVRLRDGDGCRYCGVVVQWSARRGGRAGTYDHRTPGAPARSPDELLVCCASCNGTRADNPDAEAWPLRPAPVDPYYGPDTIRFLARYGHHITGPGDPAPGGTTPGDPAPSEATPQRSAPRAPADLQKTTEKPRSEVSETWIPGTGAGTRAARPRRGRRGGRGRRSDPGGRR